VPYTNIDNSPTAMTNHIRKEKIKWNGNYEGFIGKINKFNWGFNRNGSYDITVNLVGLGDVISSLKVNFPPINNEKKQSVAYVPNGNKSKQEDLPIDKNSSQLGRELWKAHTYAITQESFSDIQNKKEYIVQSANKKIIFLQGYDYTIQDIPLYEYINDKITLKTQNITFKNSILFRDGNDISSIGVNDKTYMTFGLFMAILEKNINIQDTSPTVMYDIKYNDIDNDNNYIRTYPGHFSSNPKICIINPDSPNSNYENIDIFNKLKNIKDKIKYYSKSLAKFKKESYYNIGLLSNVYLNINYLSNIIKELRDEDNNITLNNLIKKILDDINISLGKINNFRIIHDKDTNYIKIINEVPFNKNMYIDYKYPIINTFMYLPQEGSFVKEINLNSELSDDMATALTIGAQGNPKNDIFEDSVSFSMYNKGLIDRTKPSYTIDPFGEFLDSLNLSDNNKSINIDSIIDYNLLEKLFISVYYQLSNEDDIKALTEMNELLSKVIKRKLYELDGGPSTFFLPFNLSLNLIGLGGMKIYESFKIKGNELPLTYDVNYISLIIKSLTHNITSKGWDTKIETISKID
jgi:hypothetical protein